MALAASPTTDKVAAQTGESEPGAEEWELIQRRLDSEGFAVVAGTDEAGQGPLAGPVVAGAFAVLDREDADLRQLLSEVTDSKKLSEKQRDAFFARLTDPALAGRAVWSVAEAPATEIDKINILQASLAAMARAVRALETKPDCVLVDGCNRPPDLLRPGEQWTRGTKASAQAKNDVKQQKLKMFFAAVERPEPKPEPDAPWHPKQVESVINGDGKVPCISAASILAKVHRDRLMDKLHERFPTYGFAEHKGYGTSTHLEALRKHGPCPEHRKSFGPVREALGFAGRPAAAGETPARRDDAEVACPRTGSTQGGEPTAEPAKALAAEPPTEETPDKAPAPKKRGRPPKDAGKEKTTAALAKEGPAPKKRGRPPKDAGKEKTTAAEAKEELTAAPGPKRKATKSQ